MKLTDTALSMINTTHIRARLCIALNRTESSIRRFIGTNDDNLTKAAALEVIREETGLSDSEILEKEEHHAIAV